MILQKYIYLFCSLFVVQCLAAQYVAGYEINGYEIAISKRATIVLNFNSAVTSFSISEKNPPFTVSSYIKTLKIKTFREVSKPYALFVTEGGRQHNFVIIYKDSIDFSKQIQDFSDLNNLKQIADSLQRKSEIDRQVLQQQKNLFDSLSDAGDVALTDSDYDAALINYQKALSITLPDASYYYLNQQISYLQKEIPLRNARNKQKKAEAEHSQNVSYAINIYHQAEGFIKLGNFNDALTFFKQFIIYVDSIGLTSGEYDFEKLVNYSKIKVSTIQAYVDTINAKKLRGDTLTYKLPVIKNLPSITVTYYPNPRDPKLDAIYRKYADIDLNRDPDHQLFDSIELSQQIKLKSKDIMSVNSLSISETDRPNSTRLRCQCSNHCLNLKPTCTGHCATIMG